jgi:myo-inositol-1(or 4)-monophosphatase
LPLDPLYLATAVEAALAAGVVQRRYFRQNPHIDKKGPIDLVTAADLEVERAFRTMIAARFPDHIVLGEEATSASVAAASRYRWILDPVDGTTNFAHGLALFSVSIALEVDGRLEIGVVYDPMADELFTAERGQGARLNGRRLRVSTCDEMIDALVCTGFPYSVQETRHRQIEVFAAFMAQARAVRRLGSAALDLCYVAAGRFDGFWEEQLKSWDLAAGVVIIEEAGGRITGFDGAPLVVESPHIHIVATNGRVHQRMLEVIASGHRAAAGE